MTPPPNDFARIFRSARKAELADFVGRFGKRPPAVKALGRPLSVHAPNWLAAVAGASVNRVGLLVGTVVFLGATSVSIALHLMGADVAGVDPDAWQMIALGFGLLGLICFVSWSRVRQGGGGATDAGAGFLVYDEALVHARPEIYTVLRWDEVKAILSPLASGNGLTRVVARDGRSIDLSSKVKDEGKLLGATYDKVLAYLVPEYLDRIAAGEAVKFGNLTVSRDGLGWKSKTLAWGEVTGLVVLHGSRNGLQVTAGRFSLLPWCFFEQATVSNGAVALELVRLLAPPNLLQKP